jgi:serine/threonine protein kinase
MIDYDGTPLNVVHRDVSPQNVFVCYDGQVKLVDFGIAKVAGSVARTETGQFKGKLGYIAPEQLVSTVVDRRADIFSVGVMLWEALCERRMTAGDTEGVVLQKRMNGTQRPAIEIMPTIPPELASISDRALTLHPEDRYQSAAEFRKAIDDYMAKEGMRVDDLEIAELVTEAFQVERAKIRAIIEKQIATLAASVTDTGNFLALPSLAREESMINSTTPPPPSAESLIRSREFNDHTPHSHSNAAALALHPSGVSGSGAPTFSLTQHDHPKPRRSMVAIGLVGMVACAVAAYAITWNLSRTSQSNASSSPTSMPSATSPLPSPVASASNSAGTASNEAVTPTVQLAIHVHPSDASVSLDGLLLGTTPLRADVTKDTVMHKITATSHGYVTEERIVQFDRDTSVDISLKRESSSPRSASSAAAGTDLQKEMKPKHPIDEKDPY